MNGGSSSATQTATNKADADASNKSKTDQDATCADRRQLQFYSGCGGNGKSRTSSRSARPSRTPMRTRRQAGCGQRERAGLDPGHRPDRPGSSSADQTARNSADADASNKSKTDQDATATQTAGKSTCWSGCGGNGQEQNVVQIGETKQDADADASAKQDALNTNAPSLVIGGDPSSGSSSAKQDVSNKADADASNKSSTDQDAIATQLAGDTTCWSGCGGNGQEQNVIQVGETKQDADADATAKQRCGQRERAGVDPGDGPESSARARRIRRRETAPTLMRRTRAPPIRTQPRPRPAADRVGRVVAATARSRTSSRSARRSRTPTRTRRPSRTP